MVTFPPRIVDFDPVMKIPVCDLGNSEKKAAVASVQLFPAVPVYGTEYAV